MKKMLLLLPVLCFFAACKQQPQQEAVAGALAKVGNAYITVADVEQRAQGLDADFQKFIATPAGRENFLGLMVNEELLRQQAAAAGIDKTDEYEKELRDFKEMQTANLKKFQNNLKQRMLLGKLQEDGTLSAGEQEIKDYYKKYSYQIYLLQILLDDPEEASAVTREVKRSNNRYNFESAARKFSVDPVSKKQGGALPPFIPGEFLPEIEVPAANTPLNQAQGFIKTAQGFHIFMKVKEEKLSYQEAKERIAQILEKQKMDAYLASLKSKFGVEVLNEVK